LTINDPTQTSGNQPSSRLAGTILAALAVLATRQRWREGNTVELFGPNGMPLANPADPERHADEFAE
jgi:hypothetical protein